ncbi:MAG: hypothetical protein Q4C73_08720, partial [Eubacteriales bacterium]|nr:hypothetical protein [Eubacteriales bacterium]
IPEKGGLFIIYLLMRLSCAGTGVHQLNPMMKAGAFEIVEIENPHVDAGLQKVVVLTGGEILGEDAAQVKKAALSPAVTAADLHLNVDLRVIVEMDLDVEDALLAAEAFALLDGIDDFQSEDVLLFKMQKCHKKTLAAPAS